MTSERSDRAIAELQPWIERARSFSGWDMSPIRVTPLAAGPPWDYGALARERLAASESAVDLGTGGGEVLSRTASRKHGRVVATEEWHVNAPIARDRLAPLGIGVVRADSLRLPFSSAAFDLVLDRHEALVPSEVDRVLRAGGTCLTQQVGRENLEELREFFPRMTVWPDHFAEYTRAFESMGYTVSAQEHSRKVAYQTLGDVVFQILIAPWEIEDFDPLAEIHQLLALEDEHSVPEGLALTEARYLIVATRPN